MLPRTIRPGRTHQPETISATDRLQEGRFRHATSIRLGFSDMDWEN